MINKKKFKNTFSRLLYSFISVYIRIPSAKGIAQETAKLHLFELNIYDNPGYRKSFMITKTGKFIFLEKQN